MQDEINKLKNELEEVNFRLGLLEEYVHEQRRIAEQMFAEYEKDLAFPFKIPNFAKEQKKKIFRIIGGGENE